MKQVEIWCDGACLGNPGAGGWGAHLRCTTQPEHFLDMSGGERRTTNNRMELMAAIMALEALKEVCDVTVYSDSQYVCRGISEWLPGWKADGRLARGDIKNPDLWQRLDAVASRHRVRWQWVKGHAGNPGNERADWLAGMAASRQTTLPDLS